MLTLPPRGREVLVDMKAKKVGGDKACHCRVVLDCIKTIVDHDFGSLKWN